MLFADVVIDSSPENPFFRGRSGFAESGDRVLHRRAKALNYGARQYEQG